MANFRYIESFRKSELHKLISPEIKDDRFYFYIKKITKEENVSNILEIGSSSGEGSTRAFVEGIRESSSDKARLFCLEISKKRFSKLQKTYSNHIFVKAYNCSSVPVESLLSKDQVIHFYKNKKTNLNKTRLDTILRWLEQDINYIINANVSQHGIQRIKQENGILDFDMVLIDGSAFSGLAELNEVYGAKFILLDDINDIKNYYNYQRLINDPLYDLIIEDWRLRNGFAIFKKGNGLVENNAPVNVFG